MLFPQKLILILSDPENHESITWLPCGQAFVIRNRKVFEEIVMPRYFSRKAKYSSFTRKLNRWNFFRDTSGAYRANFFLRNKPHLAAQMFCKNARTMLAMASTSRQSNNIVEKTSTPTFALASSPSHPKGLYHEDLQKAIPTVAVAFKTQKCGGSNSLQRCELNLLLQQQQNKHTDLLVTERAMLLQHPFPYDQHQQRWMHIQQMALAAMPQPQALQPSINRASAA